MKKEEEITNKQIYSLVEALAGTVAELQQDVQEFKQDMLEFKQETRSEIKELKAGQFTPEEKEDLLGIVRHINRRLENEALGKKDISLTREEYDAASGAKIFDNRFDLAKEF
jgi:DNA topoisomerase VI subunit A